jgi:xanthine dehydrogenase iron-sulfur cluster and FAD-binding subunit A
MINFQYVRASDVADAVRQVAADPGARFIAGGTNLIDLMKEHVEHPTKLIDISRLADRRACPKFRPCLSPADRTALSDARERNPGRRVGAAA